MSNMLEQAIVDAKALKDAAFKNAQDALLEQYAPQIKEAVNTILEQEEEDEMGGLFGGAGLDPDLGQGEVGGVVDDMPLAVTDGEKLCPCPDEEEEIEIDFDALEKQMRAEEEAEDMDRDDLAADLGMADKLGGEDEEEFELSEENLVSMLQEESEELGEAMKSQEEGIIQLDDEIYALLKQKGITKYDQQLAAMKAAYDKDPQTHGTDYAMALSKALGAAESMSEEVKNPGPYAGGQKAKLGLDDDGDGVPDGVDKDPKDGSVKESRNFAAQIKKTVLKERKKIESGLLKENKKLLSENKSLIKENGDLKTKAGKFRSKVKELAETLTDVNLTNAKLLYENKVLKSVSLNERQKNKVVEAISRAGSVEETKTIYETLVNSVGTSNDKRPESLNEVVSQKRTVFVNRRQKATHPEKNRWQALAGIKK